MVQICDMTINVCYDRLLTYFWDRHWISLGDNLCLWKGPLTDVFNQFL